MPFFDDIIKYLKRQSNHSFACDLTKTHPIVWYFLKTTVVSGFNENNYKNILPPWCPCHPCHNMSGCNTLLHEQSPTPPRGTHQSSGPGADPEGQALMGKGTGRRTEGQMLVEVKTYCNKTLNHPNYFFSILFFPESLLTSLNTNASTCHNTIMQW